MSSLLRSTRAKLFSSSASLSRTFSSLPQIGALPPAIHRNTASIPLENENTPKGNLTGEFGKLNSLPSLNNPITKLGSDSNNKIDNPLPAELRHGSVVIAAITSCTNTSNPSVMLGAGLVAKKAHELGLQRPKASGQDTNVLAGAGYGNGSSRVWAAKGPMLLGVNAVMARSFERNVDTNTLGLTGQKRFMSDVTGTISETKAYGRPLSPHLPVYQPQLSATLSICNRISGALLSAVILLFYMIYMKMGLISLSYDSFYQFLFYSSKLNLLAVEISALALSYHLYAGIRHLVHKL